jgi:hypothetical protein
MGAIIGAVGINAARSVLTARFPEWWLIILGSLFVGVVLFLPYGIVGLPRQCWQGLQRLHGKLRRRKSAAEQQRLGKIKGAVMEKERV